MSTSTGTPASSQANSNDRLMALLSYIITIIVPAIVLLGESKNNSFQRYHAIQSLGLAAVAVIYEIVVGLLSCAITAAVPFLGCVTWILPLLAWVPFIYYGIQAYQGKMFEIPYLTQFMRQQKWL